MASTILPFLYQTRTLQRISRVPIAFVSAGRAYATQQRKPLERRSDHSIPFELDEEDQGASSGNSSESTITPSEAEIFKGIFDEIAQGRMPKARKRLLPSEDTASDEKNSVSSSKGGEIQAPETSGEGPKSIIDQVRVTEFRDKFLQRYPVSLRKAAEMALGKFELEPQRPKLRDMTELDEEEARTLAAWGRYQQIQEAEKERVGELMRDCDDDVALWEVMEKEVFSLPEKLGILQETQATSKTRRGRRAAKGTANVVPEEKSSVNVEQHTSGVGHKDLAGVAVEDEKPSMDIHGPLYPHYLTLGLILFDTAFSRPSPLAFKILPRIKELGLPSYVLGVTTPFYTKLAEMHWNHFGDAGSTFDMLEEMRSLGLTADGDVASLLTQIRDHLHGCTWGAQGPFVMAMMESAPYDTALAQRLEASEKYVRRSFHIQRGL